MEVDCPVYSGEVTPGTTPRDHTPMMRRPIESSEEEGEEQEDEEEEREKEEEGGTTNGAFINGDATGRSLYAWLWWVCESILKPEVCLCVSVYLCLNNSISV